MFEDMPLVYISESSIGQLYQLLAGGFQTKNRELTLMSLLFSTISSNNLNQSYTFELSISSIKQTQYTKHKTQSNHSEYTSYHGYKTKKVSLPGTLG